MEGIICLIVANNSIDVMYRLMIALNYEKISFITIAFGQYV